MDIGTYIDEKVTLETFDIFRLITTGLPATVVDQAGVHDWESNDRSVTHLLVGYEEYRLMNKTNANLSVVATLMRLVFAKEFTARNGSGDAHVRIISSGDMRGGKRAKGRSYSS